MLASALLGHRQPVARTPGGHLDKQLLPFFSRSRRQASALLVRAEVSGSRGTVVVVGGGPAGVLTAIYLATLQYEVKVFDKRPEPVKGAFATDQRTIVFALNLRGRNALSKAAIRLPGDEHVDKDDITLTKASGVQQYSGKGPGKVEKRPLMPLPEGMMFVERSALVEHLFLEAQRLVPQRVTFFWDTQIEDIDLTGRTVQYSSGGDTSTADYDLIIGADGRNSRVRSAMQALNSRMRVDIVPNDRHYISFAALQPQEGFEMMDDRGTQICFSLGPNRSHAITLWRARSGCVSGLFNAPLELFQRCKKPEDYHELISTYYPHIPQLWVSQIAEQLLSARPSLAGASVRCSTITGPRCILLGDSAHGVLPNMGEGVNSAMESALVLSRVLRECSHDVEAAVARYEKQRLPDAHALYKLDRAAMARVGALGRQWWNLDFLAARVHVILGMALSKLLPRVFKGPSMTRMFGSIIPYRQAWYALQRDKAITVVGLAAAFALISLQIVPRAAAYTAAIGGTLAARL